MPQSHTLKKTYEDTYLTNMQGVVRMTFGKASSLRLDQLKKEVLHLRKEIPKLNGEIKKKAIETYSKLFNEILRLERIEEPLYLLRYE